MFQVFEGFKCYFKGIRFWLSEPILLRLSAVPIIIDIICFVVGTIIAIKNIPLVVALLVASPETWFQSVVYYFVYLVTAISLFVVVIFGVLILASVIAFPFNGVLAERTLSLREGRSIEVSRGFWARTWLNLYALAQKLFVYLFIGAFLLVAAFVPGLGLIAAAIGILLLGYEFFDYSFDANYMRFRQRISFVKQHLAYFVGWAAALGLTTLIPGINIITMPGSVVSAAYMFHELRSYYGRPDL